MVNLIEIQRYWFLTWTTYGTWLPGDRRGYVGAAPDESGRWIEHNQVGTPPAAPNPQLYESMTRALKYPPIRLKFAQAMALHEQFLETTGFRNWLLIAVAVMRTHVHMVVGVPGDPDPDVVLGDLKSYGSRRLNREGEKPSSGTWWTTGGSKRKLPDEDAVEAVIHYIRNQPNPLLIWTREDGVIFQAE